MSRRGDLTVVASAIVVGGVSPSYAKNRGFTSTIARAGAGNYTLTMQDGIDGTQSVENLVLRAVLPAAGGSIAISHTSDTAKQITISIDGALADADFSIQLMALPS